MAHLAGIDAIGKRQLVSKVGDYYVPATALFQDREVIADFSAVTGWAAMSNDTTGFELDLAHVTGTASLEFDKVNGAANTAYGAIEKTLSPTIDLGHFCMLDHLRGLVYVSSNTDVLYGVIRLGTDATNYNEWRIPATAFAAGSTGWNVISVALDSAYVGVGANGWDMSAIAYVLVGLVFKAETDTLADIRWDSLEVVTRVSADDPPLYTLSVPSVSLVQDREVLGDFDSIAGWTAYNNDTTGVETEIIHCLGTASVEFDKVDGLANTRYSGVCKTLSPAVDCSRFTANDKLYTAFYVSGIGNITHAYIRIGTDVTNYSEWRLLVALPIVAGVWHVWAPALNEAVLAGQGGNGWDQSAVTYIQVGMYHDAAADLLADIRFDHLFIATAQLTSA